MQISWVGWSTAFSCYPPKIIADNINLWTKSILHDILLKCSPLADVEKNWFPGPSTLLSSDPLLVLLSRSILDHFLQSWWFSIVLVNFSWKEANEPSLSKRFETAVSHVMSCKFLTLFWYFLNYLDHFLTISTNLDNSKK